MKMNVFTRNNLNILQIYAMAIATVSGAQTFVANATSVATTSETQPAPAASTALIEQAKQDGLTIEQERYIQSLSKDPKHHWEGYSDKPVPAKLGPNTFMFPMNLYDNQMGPDFQGSVALILHWPDLKAFPPGAKQNQKYSKSYMNESIIVNIHYIDRRPIETLLKDSINEGPSHRGWIDQDDPTAHRSLRIEGTSTYGLTPYYTDIKKLTAYFQRKGINASKANVNRVGEDWYLDDDANGDLRTVIICTSKNIPGASLIHGRLEETTPGVHRGGCTQTFTIHKYNLSLRLSYLRAYLKDWKMMEETIRDIFNKYKTAKDKDGDPAFLKNAIQR